MRLIRQDNSTEIHLFSTRNNFTTLFKSSTACTTHLFNLGLTISLRILNKAINVCFHKALVSTNIDAQALFDPAHHGGLMTLKLKATQVEA